MGITGLRYENIPVIHTRPVPVLVVGIYGRYYLSTVPVLLVLYSTVEYLFLDNEIRAIDVGVLRRLCAADTQPLSIDPERDTKWTWTATSHTAIKQPRRRRRM